MRNLIFVFIVAFAFSCSSDDDGNTTNPDPVVQCANVFLGNVSLTSQTQVDEFAAQGYCGVKGNLSIGGYNTEDGHPIPSDILDLSKLKDLKVIYGSLEVYSNDNLLSLIGLDSIQKVGSLSINNNLKLQNLGNLGSLKEVSPRGSSGSEIYIGGNYNLKDLQGLEKLGNIDNVIIKDNYNLKNLKGLEKIKNVERILIDGNSNLLNLEGLEGLEKIGRLEIQSNTELTTLKGLENVATIKLITLFLNAKLTTTEHLTGLKTLSDFWCSENPLLTSLSGLKQITKLRSLTIGRSDRLSSLQALHNVTEIKWIELFQNPLIVSFQGLENLKALSGLHIYNSPEFSSLEHLSGVTSFPKYNEADSAIKQGIFLDNTSVISLSGFQNVTSFTGSISILSNPDLKNFCAIKNIVASATSFKIKDNAYNPTKEDIIAGNCSQ